MGSGAASGALSGAATGAAVGGPVGAGVGLVVGGLIGGLGDKEAKKQAKLQKQQLAIEKKAQAAAEKGQDQDYQTTGLVLAGLAGVVALALILYTRKK